MDALPGERARLKAAQWVLRGNLFFATVGVALHTFFCCFVDHLPINWSYQIPTLGIGAAALLSLRWLRRSLSKSVLFFTSVGMVCAGAILFHELEARHGSTDYDQLVVVAIFHVGIFALGLILGFKPAIWYASAVAVFLLVIGIIYGMIFQMILPIALAYAVALPSKVVEQLIEESTAELSKINVKLREEIEVRTRAENELKRHRERLAELVKERTAELMTANEQLRGEIVERERAEESLRQHAVELEARNEELDAFAHTVAHGLKNPLTTIIGFGAMLENYHARMSPEEPRRYSRAIVQSGRKMDDLIEELLLLSNVRKMEEIETGPLDMGAIVAEAQGRLTNLIEEHQATIIVSENWPIALSYGPWVEEVWANYLGNAIKYGGRPPRVELGATAPQGTSDMARFWVRDNGLGLTVEDQALLFTPFTRLHQVPTKGHGLGLSIVRRIVEKLGGQVGVESKLGQGSVFSFTLPGVATDSGGPAVSPEQS